MVTIGEKIKMLRFKITKAQADTLIAKGLEGGWLPLDTCPEMFITPKKNLRVIEGTLNMKAAKVTPLSKYEFIAEVDMEENKLPKNLPYEILEWNEASPYTFLDIFDALEKKYGSFRIGVSKGAQSSLNIVVDDKPTLYFNTGWLYVPADRMEQKVSLFGYRIENIQFRDTGSGIPLFDDSTGVTWGEIQKKTVVIFFNPFNREGAEDGIPKIFDAIFASLNKTPQEEIARIQGLKKELSLKRIKEIMLREAIKGCEKKTQDINHLNREIDDLYTSCGKKGNELRQLVEELNSMTLRKAKVEENAEAYLRAIEAFPKVENLEFSSGLLIVNTKMLTCEHPTTHKVHMIGKFRIEFSFADNWGIKFFNRTLTKRPGDKQAVHVYADGHACLGNSESTFSQLFGEGLLVDVIEYALMIPQSVTPFDSFGRYLYSWPLWKGTESHRIIKYGRGHEFEISEGETFAEAYSHVVDDENSPSEFTATLKDGTTKKKRSSEIVSPDVVSFE